MGYSDDDVRRLCREALADGWTHFKVKVGSAPEEDARRLALVREEIGPSSKLMIDANQTLGRQRGDRVRSSALPLQPVVDRGADEPGRCAGSRDDRKAVRPVGVATGEHCANRILFKQLLQAEAIDFCQIDSCRLGGVNENLAVMLMAAKFGVPVCPHAGGVGLCELVQHLSLFDYIAISGRMDDRVTEFVDHLHEHFVDPVVVRRGRYMAPTQPGYSSTITPETRAAYRYPDGPMWTSVEESRPA